MMRDSTSPAYYNYHLIDLIPLSSISTWFGIRDVRPKPILIKLKNISDFGSGTQNITIISLLILTCRHNHASTRRNEI